MALGSGVKRQIVCDCLEAGTNVIVEKPVALSLEDADAMIETAAKNGVKLCVNHQLRFCPSMRALHAEVADGSFGRLLHGAAQIRRNRNKAYFDAGKWRGTWKNDGGTLMNQCIHYTDLLQWMFGDADEVFAYTDRLTHPYIEAEDMGLALIRFKNGAYATVEGTVNVYPNNLSDALAVFGETGTVSVSGKYLDQVERWQFENGTDSLPGAIEKYAVADMGTGHTPLYRDMIDAIEHDREPVCAPVSRGERRSNSCSAYTNPPRAESPCASRSLAARRWTILGGLTGERILCTSVQRGGRGCHDRRRDAHLAFLSHPEGRSHRQTLLARPERERIE